MSVTGVNNARPDLLSARLDQTIDRPLDKQSQPGAATPSGANAPSSIAPRPASTSALTPQPPVGTDPALWSILTGEERAFFANHETSGPLTYSKIMMPNRGAQSAIPSVRGGRVDVRA
jgi:hypothetical protein